MPIKVLNVTRLLRTPYLILLSTCTIITHVSTIFQSTSVPALLSLVPKWIGSRPYQLLIFPKGRLVLEFLILSLTITIRGLAA